MHERIIPALETLLNFVRFRDKIPVMIPTAEKINVKYHLFQRKMKEAITERVPNNNEINAILYQLRLIKFYPNIIHLKRNKVKRKDLEW